ncbi:MAG: hypothetical protein AB1410_08270 [Acidobacteriota bacterium]
MKKVLTFFVSSIFLICLAVVSQERSQEITVKGELIDVSCYFDHEAKGAPHKKCALACTQKGFPMGVLTEKGEVYLLFPDHKNEDPYEKAKGMAAEFVEAKGKLIKKAGIPSIVLSSIEKVSKSQ